MLLRVLPLNLEAESGGIAFTPEQLFVLTSKKQCAYLNALVMGVVSYFSATLDT